MKERPLLADVERMVRVEVERSVANAASDLKGGANDVTRFVRSEVEVGMDKLQADLQGLIDKTIVDQSCTIKAAVVGDIESWTATEVDGIRASLLAEVGVKLETEASRIETDIRERLSQLHSTMVDVTLSQFTENLEKRLADAEATLVGL